MKTLFERVFNGSDEMFAKAEEEVNKIVAEVGRDAPLTLPSTAYFCACIYAYIGKKVTTTGELQDALADVKAMMLREPRTHSIFQSGVGTAIAGTALTRHLGILARHGTRVTAVVLIATGAYLAWYWLPAATGHTASGGNLLTGWSATARIRSLAAAWDFGPPCISAATIAATLASSSSGATTSWARPSALASPAEIRSAVWK